MLRGSAWTLHAPRWERSRTQPGARGAALAARCFWPISTYRNQEPAAQSGKCQKGTLGLFGVRGDSGSCQRHGKRGAGGRAAASSPSQRRHSDRSQPCESLSKRREPRRWRCRWAGSPDPRGFWGAPRGNPLPPCPRPPPSAPTSLGTGLSPGQAPFPFASRRNARSEREVLVWPPPSTHLRAGDPLLWDPAPLTPPGNGRGAARAERGDGAAAPSARESSWDKPAPTPRLSPPLRPPVPCPSVPPGCSSEPSPRPPGRAARRPVPLGTSLGRRRVSRRD